MPVFQAELPVSVRRHQEVGPQESSNSQTMGKMHLFLQSDRDENSPESTSTKGQRLSLRLATGRLSTRMPKSDSLPQQVLARPDLAPWNLLYDASSSRNPP